MKEIIFKIKVPFSFNLNKWEIDYVHPNISLRKWSMLSIYFPVWTSAVKKKVLPFLYRRYDLRKLLPDDSIYLGSNEFNEPIIFPAFDRL